MKHISNEEKQLLFTDLSARLPYGVIVEYGCKHEGKDLGERKSKLTGRMIDSFFESLSIGMSETYSLRPYLRPMSSMTEKEVNELKMICDEYDLHDECGDIVSTIYGMTVLYGKVEDVYPCNLKIKISPNINYAVLDYLNSHHFDYRGLIEKGLALDAPEGMYS